MLIKTEYTFSRNDLVQLARTKAFEVHPDGNSICPPKNIVEKDDGSVVVTLEREG